MINKVMDPLKGVEKTMINVALRQVSVDHDPNLITAKEIENVLNKNKFGATVKQDGGVSNSALATTSSGGTGRSQFHVQKICCASEIPAVTAVLKPMEGVSKVQINTTTKMVCSFVCVCLCLFHCCSSSCTNAKGLNHNVFY